MDDFGNRISQILNDPGQMEQIAALARSLGLDQTPTPQPEPEPIPPGMLQLLRQVNRIDGRQEALLQALKPFLKPGRQQSVERAMQAARLSRLAGFAVHRDSGPETK